MKALSFLLFFLITDYWSLITAKAADLGIHSHTFKIQEPDFLKELESKLHHLRKNGELEKHKEILIKKAEEAIHTPAPVEGITQAAKQRIFYYDPSITVPYDLKDHQGRVFHKKGTRFNPLQYRSLSSILIFMDGSNKDQVSWVEKTYLKQNQKTKIILTAGSPFELMEALKEPIYFDQGGTLIKKFGIKHVPAFIVQEGLKLKIIEIAVEENLK